MIIRPNRPNIHFDSRPLRTSKTGEIPIAHEADTAGEWIKIRAETLLDYEDSEYSPPTADEIREALKRGSLTGARAGKLLGVNDRTIRKWTGGEQSIPYSAWRSLLIYVWEVKPVRMLNMSISNLRCLDLDRVTPNALAQIIDERQLESDPKLEQMIRFDVARISSYFHLESKLPSSSDRATDLQKTTNRVNRLHTHLMELESRQHKSVARALSGLVQPDLSDSAACLLYLHSAIIQLQNLKYRLRGTKFDRALTACAEILTGLDDETESDLFDGMGERGSKPELPNHPGSFENFAYCLTWISRAGKNILPFVSKSGPRWTPGIHTAVAYLAPRYKQLTGERASYWGEEDDVPEQSFQNFVMSVLEAAGKRLSLNRVRGAIRNYCQYRNKAEALQKTG